MRAPCLLLLPPLRPLTRPPRSPAPRRQPDVPCAVRGPVGLEHQEPDMRQQHLCLRGDLRRREVDHHVGPLQRIQVGAAPRAGLGWADTPAGAPRRRGCWRGCWGPISPPGPELPACLPPPTCPPASSSAHPACRAVAAPAASWATAPRARRVPPTRTSAWRWRGRRRCRRASPLAAGPAAGGRGWGRVRPGGMLPCWPPVEAQPRLQRPSETGAHHTTRRSCSRTSLPPGPPCRLPWALATACSW